MSLISHISIFPMNFEMRHPFITNLGSKSVTKNLVLEVGLRSNVLGRGEASASLALPHETQANMSAWLKKIVPAFIGQPVENVQPLAQSPLFRELAEDGHPTALGALEAALLDAYAQDVRKPLCSFFGKNRAPLETDVTLSAWPTALTLKIARQHFRQGFRRFKVKVGKLRLEKDFDRLRQLIEAFPEIILWIDANQGWTVAEVKKFSARAEKENWPVAALEQPTPKKDFAALKKARQVCAYPIFADESAGNVHDLEKLLKLKALSGVVIKIAKSGLAEAMEMTRLAREEGIRTMLSCMAESGEGLALSVHWAMGDGKFDWVDLDSFILTKSDQPLLRYQAKGPKIMFRNSPKLVGVHP